MIEYPEVDAAEVYVPGEFRCAKCGFTVSQFTMSAIDGSIGSRDHPGEKCPNDGAPLWRVTWKQRAMEHYERAAEEIARANTAEAALDAMRDQHKLGRANIDVDGKDLLICWGLHEKAEKCEFVRYVTAETQHHERWQYLSLGRGEWLVGSAMDLQGFPSIFFGRPDEDRVPGSPPTAEDAKAAMANGGVALLFTTAHSILGMTYILNELVEKLQGESGG